MKFGVPVATRIRPALLLAAVVLLAACTIPPADGSRQDPSGWQQLQVDSPTPTPSQDDPRANCEERDLGYNPDTGECFLRPTPAPSAATGSTGSTFTLELAGTGFYTSEVFTITGGSYSVTWMARPQSDIGGVMQAWLEPVGGGMLELIVNERLNSATERSGETNLHNVAPGDYFVTVNAVSAIWELTVSQP